MARAYQNGNVKLNTRGGLGEIHLAGIEPSRPAFVPYNGDTFLGQITNCSLTSEWRVHVHKCDDVIPLNKLLHQSLVPGWITAVIRYEVLHGMTVDATLCIHVGDA